MGEAEDRSWHLDRKVPIALIVAIAVQTASAFWWAASVSARVEYLENQVKSSSPYVEKVIRLESQLEAIKEGVTEIKTELKSLTRRDLKVR
jgi:Tfp pilus assembly protein PilO